MKNENLSEDQDQKPAGLDRWAEVERSSSNEIAAAPPLDEVTGGAHFSHMNLGSLQLHKVEHWLAELLAERHVTRVQGLRHHR